MAEILVRILWGVFSLIMSQAIFQGLHLAGIYPDRALALMFTSAPNASLLGLIYWSLSAITALLLWGIGHFFLYHRKKPDIAAIADIDGVAELRDSRAPALAKAAERKVGEAAEVALSAAAALLAPTREPMGWAPAEADVYLCEAIEHIVDGSTVLLTLSRRFVMESGPAAGLVLTDARKATDEAITEINEHLMAGTLLSWGRRQKENKHHQDTFEQMNREIPVSYWDKMCLNRLTAATLGSGQPQTASIAAESSDLNYADIMLCRRQLLDIWPPKRFSENELMSLSDASLQLHEQERHTLIGGAARQLGRPEGTDEGALNHLAGMIVDSRRVPLYGIMSLSTILERIFLPETRRMEFVNGGTLLCNPNEPKNRRYTDLKIRKQHLEKALGRTGSSHVAG